MLIFLKRDSKLTSVLLLEICSLFLSSVCDATIYTVNLVGTPGGGYLLKVSLGSNRQEVLFLLDSGSANLVVAGKKFPGVSAWYAPNSSMTSRSLYKSMVISYGQGNLTADLFTDSLQLLARSSSINNTEEYITQNVPVNLAVVKTDSGIFQSGYQPSFDGIMGVAYQDLVVQPSGGKPRLISLMDTIFSSLRIPDLFAVQFCGSYQAVRNLQSKKIHGSPFKYLQVGNIRTSGKFTLGYPRETFDDSLSTPIIRAAYYQVVVVDILIEGQHMGTDCLEYNSGSTIIDTGTSNIRLPSRVFKRVERKLFSVLNKTIPALLQSGNIFQADAKICLGVSNVDEPIILNTYSFFPTIQFYFFAGEQFSNKAIGLSLSPQQYLRYLGRFNAGGSVRDCFILTLTDSESNDFVLGMSFVEGFNILFDRGGKKVKFADSDCVSYDSNPELPTSRILGLVEFNITGTNQRRPWQCSKYLLDKYNLWVRDICIIIFSVLAFVIIGSTVAFFLIKSHLKKRTVTSNTIIDSFEA